ncbi:MAG: matrixin family metalloprotease [Labilithrix sp.]|nr:matrixin family metalloprotease [Labilithrix sp.]
MMLSPRRGGARRHVAVLAMMGALALVPRTGEAYCRTTTSPIPASYSPSSGCFTKGLFLYWKGACIGYSIQQAASQNVSFEDATRIIDAAFATWNNVECPGSGGAVGTATSNLGPVSCAEVRYNPTGPNQNLIVFRDDRWPYSDPNNTLGLTTVTFNADTGEIYDADMEINASGRNLSISDVVPPNGFDLLSVITHEAGHFLGLAHATSASSTMFASYRPGSSALRSLSGDDIAGICEIYPDTAIRSVSTQVAATGRLAATACDPTPRHGFGSTCDANPAPSDSNDKGCAVTAGASSSPAATLGAAGLAVALLLRRRRGAV